MKNLLVFIAIGIPLLVVAQVPDAVRFFFQTFSNQATMQEIRNYQKAIPLKDFLQLYDLLNDVITDKTDDLMQMNAVEFVNI